MIPVDTPEDLAETLGLLRKLTGRTQTDIGTQAGIPTSRIGDYEHCRRTPNPATTLRHLAALGYRLAIIPADKIAPETAAISTQTPETLESGPTGTTDHVEALTGRSGEDA